MARRPSHFGNDHWTLELADLGMKDAGDALARLVLTCRPPYAVCVQGKWGSGKTSLMRYAMARLGGAPLATTLLTAAQPVDELPADLGKAWKKIANDSTVFIEETVRPQLVTPPVDLRPLLQIVPIWFNAWQHQTAEQPVVALFQEMRQQFTSLLKVGGKLKKLSSVAVEAGLTILGELADTLSVLHGGPKTGFGGIFGRVRDVGEAYEKRHFETRHDAQRLQLLFEQAVDRLLRPERDDDEAFAAGYHGTVALRRLVIFVDDLDRCAEAQTVRLLEAIKLYLQTHNCVFVVGMDSVASRRAVASVLGHADETAQEYLEKLFQTTFMVPVPRARKSFVEGLLAYHGLDAGIAARVVALAEPNPRKVKSFVAGLAAGWRVCGTGDSVDGHFLLVHYLRAYHPDVYRLLGYDPEQVGDLNRVLSEGLTKMWADASPVAYFFRDAFIHAVDAAFGENDAPDRATTEAIVSRLARRIDRHKSDRAFVAAWRTAFRDADAAEVLRRLAPFLDAEPGGTA